MYVLNASGTAPTGATLKRFNELGYRWDPRNWGPNSGMPDSGILTVTVPGTVWGWQAVLQRFGKLTFKKCSSLPPNTPRTASRCRSASPTTGSFPLPLPLKGCCTQLDPDSVKVWYVNGRPPSPGQIFRHPDLARTFRLLQAHGADVFYKGEIAQAIVAKSKALGGTMTLEDLANYRAEWVEPARSEYRGYELLSCRHPHSRGRRMRCSTFCRRACRSGRQEQRLRRWARRIRSTGTSSSRPRSSLTRISFGTTPTRISRKCLWRSCCPTEHAESLCSQVRSAARLRDRPAGRRGFAGRHHRAVHGRQGRQHGVLGEQQLQRVRIGHHRARLWLRAAQSRRPVHARPEKSERDRAAQEAVQHAVGGVADACWRAA